MKLLAWIKSMSWLAWVNFLFFQWFFIRLFKNVENDGTVLGWGFMGVILPLTGWLFLPWERFVPLPAWNFYFWERTKPHQK